MPRHFVLGLLLASGAILATEHYPDRYPEPEVIYQDPELIEKVGPLVPVDGESAKASTDERYPGAYHTPKVIYQNPELIEKVGPLIDLSEENPKPVEMTAVEAPPRPVEVEEATPPYGLLLLVLGVAAFLFFWQRPGRQEPTPPHSGEADAQPSRAHPEDSDSDRKEHKGGAAAYEDITDIENGEEVIEEIATKVERKINRHRAGKTKRTRVRRS